MSRDFVWIFHMAPPELRRSARQAVLERGDYCRDNPPTYDVVSRWRRGETPWVQKAGFDAGAWADFQWAFAGRSHDDYWRLTRQAPMELGSVAGEDLVPAALIWAGLGPEVERAVTGPLGVFHAEGAGLGALVRLLERTRADQAAMTNLRAIVERTRPKTPDPVAAVDVLLGAARRARAASGALVGFSVDQDR